MTRSARTALEAGVHSSVGHAGRIPPLDLWRLQPESAGDDGALNNGRHHVHMHADDAAPHPFWTLLLLYRLLWPALWPVLIAAAGVIAMILRAGW